MSSKNENYYDNLRGAIVKTIAFFDIFDWSLTAEEVWRFLFLPSRREEVEKALAGPGRWQEKDGHYFLPGREDLVYVRRRRYQYFLNKLERARKVAWLFSLVPWVRLIAIGNIIGWGNTKDSGDIDLFIITDQKRVYLTRFFCTGLAKVLGLRPNPRTKKDKICLSFYFSGKDLDLSGLHLNFKDLHQNFNKRDFFDIYFLHWLAHLFVLYETDNAYSDLLRENPWLKRYLPNWEPMSLEHEHFVRRHNPVFYKDLWELWLGGLEDPLKRWQRRIMPDDLARLIGQGGGVVVNDQVIKMFKNDKRRQVFNEWRKKAGRYGG